MSFGHLVDILPKKWLYNAPNQQIADKWNILLPQSSRKELATDIESLKKKIAGTE
jgi:hypothetical protein